MMIENREELVNELKEILMQFDKDCNSYQTDVYFYYDNKNQTGSLDTFVNVGGNSWLNDDHYTIYTDKEHYDNYPIDYWCGNLGDICYSLGITEEQLRHDAAIELYDDEEEAEGLEYWELEKYIDNNEDFRNKLFEEYCDFIDDNAADYEERAEELIANVEDIPYFTNEYGDECWIEVVCGSNADLEKLNGYAEKYSTKHEVDIEELKETLMEKGILVYNGQFGGYEINVKAMEREEE